jgi:hypothetical protein
MKGMICFTPRLFHPRGNIPRYKMGRRLGGPQSQSGRYGEGKKLAPARNQTPAFHPIARRYTDRAVLALAPNIQSV